MMTSKYHDPVLLQESVDALVGDVNGVYVDATMGGGGHTREILRRLGKEGTLFGIDQDESAGMNVPDDNRFTWIRHNYRHMKRFMRFFGVEAVSGVLADFGVSSHQFDEAERGFSIRFEGPLDMRMNRDSAKTAAVVCNTYAQDSLAGLFREYGELRNARDLARAIVAAREQRKLSTTEDLKAIVHPLAERGNESQYMARVFQALRIEVNEELDAIRDFLQQSSEILSPGGKLVVISYHSLEDRLVKQFIAHGKFDGEAERDLYGNIPQVPLKAVNKKPIEAGEEEVLRNPRARSAKMRIAIKN